MVRKFIERAFEVKEVKDDGTFVGIASPFGEIDSYRDIVMPGAFTKSLQQFADKNRKVPMLWQHDIRTPIGIYPEVKETDTALIVTGACNMDVQKGQECHSLMKQGALTGLSIGYNTVRDEWDDKMMTRKLFEVDLWEISPVTFPSADSARVVSVKEFETVLTDLPACEAYLRDAGFSKAEATALVSRIKSIATRRDSAASDDVQRAIDVLRGINFN